MKKTLQKFDMLTNKWLLSYNKGFDDVLKIKALLPQDEQREFVVLFQNFKDAYEQLMRYLLQKRSEIFKSK